MELRTDNASEVLVRPRLLAVDALLRSKNLGSIHELGLRLGLREQSTENVDGILNSSLMARLWAPLPARIEEVLWDRSARALTAAVAVGSAVPGRELAVALYDPSQPVSALPTMLPVRPARRHVVTLADSVPGEGSVVRLFFQGQQIDELRVSPSAPSVGTEDESDSRSRETTGNWMHIEPLDRGGHGEAWSVKHRVDGREGVLKRLLPDRKTERRAKRLRHEAEMLRRLQGRPFIVPLLDWSKSEEKEPWLVTERAALGSVHDRREVFKGDLWRSLRLCRDVASGLRAAHAQEIVHRDVKPGNLLLFGWDQVALTDFGIGHAPDQTDLTTEGERVRTEWFSPPESDRIDSTPAPTWDVFMLGRTLYFLLSGGTKYQTSPEDPAFDLSRLLGMPHLGPVNDVVAWMTRTDPSARPQTMDLVIRRLDDLLQGLLRPSPNLCQACGKGQYETVGILEPVNSYLQLKHPETGVATYFTATKMEMRACRACGHATSFFLQPATLPRGTG